MYVKKKYRQLLNLADKTFIIPSFFQKFINEQELLHNLVIKSKGGQCVCTCCQSHFVAQTKVNCVIKCPNCKQRLLVKTDRLQSYTFKDNLQLLDKVKDTYILRTFELYSSYNNNKVKHCITEFMRTILEDNQAIDFVTNQVHNHMGYMYVAHYQDFEFWRGRNYRWAYRDVYGIICPYNLKSLFKGTPLQYSQLDKFVAHVEYIDFIQYMKLATNYPSFEMLVKMKLYNLARDADKFNYGKNFQERFGVPKTFYPFIKRHNLEYKQLEVLKLLQKEDIKLINKLLNYHNLEELSHYVNLEKAYYNVLKTNYRYEYEYLDYLRACKKLQYPMNDNKILYPKNLKKEHDRVTKLVEIVQNEANDKLIQERLETLNQNIYHNKKYIVFPAPSVASLIEESRQLDHCVKTYAERYSLGETDIYFLRKIETKNIPLVTIEVKKDKVLQSRAKYNEPPSDEQLKFITNWQTKILART